jgi:D-serine deaminase-like pyridoxal phosphate-dependent protein
MELADYFEFRNVGKHLNELQTPVPIIDLDVVKRNVVRWQARCDALGIKNRPHIKTHKLAGLAKFQIDRGACGITVQKLGEAEVMADAGIADMLLTFNVVGQQKLQRLSALLQRVNISVVADNEDVLTGYSFGEKLSVFVECDTGAARSGVQSPAAALALAQKIDSDAHLHFAGLMTYPAAGQRIRAAEFLQEAKALCLKSGLDVETISSGGSPDMWSDEGLSGITEYRAGTNVYFDRSLVERGVCKTEDCALTVLATVVSLPTSQRAIIDAGTKALTSDLNGLNGFGVVPELGGAAIYNANEEHGFLDISNLKTKPCVGDLVRIVPNHVCPVTNLFDEVVMVRGDLVLGAVNVDARGKVQ